MRAVMVSRHGGPEVLELADLETPSPGPRQLLVDVAVAGVNFRDVYEREGFAYGGTPPFVAGAEGSGTVAAIGEGVTDFRVGDRVAWSSAQGSYAEQVLVDTAKAVHGARRRQRRDRRRRAAAGNDRALPVQRRLPGAGRRHRSRARRGRRGGTASDPARACARRARDRDRLDRREGGAVAGGRSIRDDPLRGLRGARPRRSPTARASRRSTTAWGRPRSTTASRASACAGRSRCTATRAGRSTRSTSGV